MTFCEKWMGAPWSNGKKTKQSSQWNPSTSHEANPKKPGCEPCEAWKSSMPTGRNRSWQLRNSLAPSACSKPGEKPGGFGWRLWRLMVVENPRLYQRNGAPGHRVKQLTNELSRPPKEEVPCVDVGRPQLFVEPFAALA